MARSPRPPAPPRDPEPTVSGLPTLPRRSLGLKLLLVCLLAFLMSIPAMMVFGLLMDRSNRAESVATEIGALMGGPQTFLGPVIALPYTQPQAVTAASNGEAPTSRATQGIWYIFPTEGRVEAATESEVRRRSLFRVTVYDARLDYRATFDMAAAARDLPAGAIPDWSRAEIVLGASDARGARADLTLVLPDRTAILTPSKLDSTVTLNAPEMRGRDLSYAQPGEIKLFGTPLTPADRASGMLSLTGSTRFSGASRIAVVPFAGTTEAAIRGDWPHPSYNGGFLPTQQGEGGEPGFAASWSVPFIARGVPAEGSPADLARLGQSELGVSFVEPSNPYQSVGRSLKYAPMFIGLVFLAYFLFETTTGRRVHPAQYVLVGLAQVIFYMLLLSIAEHTGFDIAFALAATATVGLISAYAGWTFDSRAQGVRALVAFTFLYGLIYVLMRLEDYALLVGALASFAAIAAVMYFTRKVDWYGVTGQDSKGVL